MKLAAIWAWILGHGTALILASVVAFLVLTKVQSCRDSDDSAKGAVLTEKLKVDTVTDKQDSIGRAVAERQLDAANETISQLVGRIRSAPQPIRAGTPHDSITQLSAAVRACRADNDTLVKSVVEFQSACKAYRDSATKSLANKDIRYAHLDSLYHLGTREKRVQAYGDLLYEPLKSRPVVGVGMTTTLFWKLHGKVDVQYSIPKPDSVGKPAPGDGFRWLAGAHIKF